MTPSTAGGGLRFSKQSVWLVRRRQGGTASVLKVRDVDGCIGCVLSTHNLIVTTLFRPNTVPSLYSLHSFLGSFFHLAIASRKAGLVSAPSVRSGVTASVAGGTGTVVAKRSDGVMAWRDGTAARTEWCTRSATRCGGRGGQNHFEEEEGKDL